MVGKAAQKADRAHLLPLLVENTFIVEAKSVLEKGLFSTMKEALMEILTMGKVVVAAKIENLHDVYNANRGKLSVDNIRSTEVVDALIDTGATLLSLPRRMIEQLGLERQRSRTARTAAGVVAFGVYEAVRLTVQGRDCVVEVMELPDECPVLIGQNSAGRARFRGRSRRPTTLGQPRPRRRTDARRVLIPLAHQG